MEPIIPQILMLRERLIGWMYMDTIIKINPGELTGILKQLDTLGLYYRMVSTPGFTSANKILFRERYNAFRSAQ